MNVVIEHGDTSVGRPIETTWVASNGDVIIVRTWRASASQSDDDWFTAHDAYFDAAWAAHPPASP
jgi:hypothetical protein